MVESQCVAIGSNSHYAVNHIALARRHGKQDRLADLCLAVGRTAHKGNHAALGRIDRCRHIAHFDGSSGEVQGVPSGAGAHRLASAIVIQVAEIPPAVNQVMVEVKLQTCRLARSKLQGLALVQQLGAHIGLVVVDAVEAHREVLVIGG